MKLTYNNNGHYNTVYVDTKYELNIMEGLDKFHLYKTPYHNYIGEFIHKCNLIFGLDEVIIIFNESVCEISILFRRNRELFIEKHSISADLLKSNSVPRPYIVDSNCLSIVQKLLGQYRSSSIK